MTMLEHLQHLPGQVRNALETAALRIQNPAGAEFLWDRVLTPGERKRLGNNLESAYQRYGGTVGLWLNVRGGTLQRAVVEVAYSLGLLVETDRRWLLRELEESLSKTAVPVVIEWDCKLGELRFNGELIRNVRTKMADNVVAVLDAFQDNGWVEQIEDPLSDRPDGQTLRETIRSLNIGLERIRFFADGTSQGIRWHVQ